MKEALYRLTCAVSELMKRNLATSLLMQMLNTVFVKTNLVLVINLSRNGHNLCWRGNFCLDLIEGFTYVTIILIEAWTFLVNFYESKTDTPGHINYLFLTFPVKRYCTELYLDHSTGAATVCFRWAEFKLDRLKKNQGYCILCARPLVMYNI